MSLVIASMVGFITVTHGLIFGKSLSAAPISGRICNLFRLASFGRLSWMDAVNHGSLPKDLAFLAALCVILSHFIKTRLKHRYIAFLKNSLEQIQKCGSSDQLRGYEGEAASIYFGVYDQLILQQKEDFAFHGRNKRPPLDNVNALLSFVYTLLTNSITSALECVGLDPYVGYLHTERPGRASLSLDLIEELRAILADRFVLTLINKRMISGKGFSQKENGAVLMDDETRRKVITEWQNKKKEVITHPYLGEKVEWGMIPYVQAMLLARYLRGDLDGYPVFLWK